MGAWSHTILWVFVRTAHEFWPTLQQHADTQISAADLLVGSTGLF